MASAETLGDAPTFRELVAAEVRAHMARQRISGRALSRMIQRDQTWLSRRLNCAIPIDMDDLDLIAHALGMTPMELLAGIPFRPVAPQTTPAFHRTNRRNPAGTPRHLELVPPLSVVHDSTPERADTDVTQERAA
jgi:hypothetical protein